jgi:hypothetical protein
MWMGWEVWISWLLLSMITCKKILEIGRVIIHLFLMLLKTQALLISRRRRSEDVSSVVILRGDSVWLISDVVKILLLCVDRGWSIKVEKAGQLCGFSHFFYIVVSFSEICVQGSWNLSCALIVPIFLYTEVLFVFLLWLGADFRIIEIAFIAYTRYVYGLRRFDPKKRILKIWREQTYHFILVHRVRHRSERTSSPYPFRTILLRSVHIFSDDSWFRCLRQFPALDQIFFLYYLIWFCDQSHNISKKHRSKTLFAVNKSPKPLNLPRPSVDVYFFIYSIFRT